MIDRSPAGLAIGRRASGPTPTDRPAQEASGAAWARTGWSATWWVVPTTVLGLEDHEPAVVRGR
jgi:hypothetical protein